jgi:hypothetical protein
MHLHFNLDTTGTTNMAELIFESLYNVATLEQQSFNKTSFEIIMNGRTELRPLGLWLVSASKKKSSVAFVRKRTIPTERPPLVGEVSATFCG